MKKIIFLLNIFVLTISVNAQQFVEVTDFATGTKKLINITALQSSAGVSKTYVDSAVGNKALQSYVNTSITNLQNWTINQLALKADKGTTGTGEGQIINLPEQTWYKVFAPIDYKVKYSDGTVQGVYSLMSYSTHYNVNSRSNRPDQVLQIVGYNSNPNNGRKDTTDASWDFSVESHYDIPTFINPAFEFHTQRMKTTSGKEIRGFSWYVDKVTGGGFHNMVTNSLSLFAPGFEDKPPYAELFDGRLVLQNNTPGNSGTGLYLINDDGTTIELHQRGGVPVFNIPAKKSMGANYSLHFDSWNGLGLVQGFYNTNAEARAANLRPGIDTYWTRSSDGKKVLAQVE